MLDEELLKLLPTEVLDQVDLGQSANLVTIVTETEKTEFDEDGNEIVSKEISEEQYVEFETIPIDKTGEEGDNSKINQSKKGELQIEQIEKVQFDKSSKAFLACQKKDTKEPKGILHCNLENLEVFRQKITQPWFYFHWVRTFEYLLLDLSLIHI